MPYRSSALRIDIAIAACAISAGIHGALIREHFEEGTGAGAGFVAATVLLAVLAVVLTYRATPIALLATVATFAGLIAAYALVVWTGVPVLHPEREAADGLALFTKAVEAAGLVAAASAIRLPALAFTIRHPKGTLT
jgi:hypothetical protein